MQRYFWEATLNNGERLREGLHPFSRISQENLVRLMLIGPQDTVFFDMAAGVLYLNVSPIRLQLGERSLCGRPDDYFTFKHAEFCAGAGGVGNRIIQYDIGYTRQVDDCRVKIAYVFPVAGPGYLQLELTPEHDICRELSVMYCSAEFKLPTELPGGQTWQIEFNIR